MIEVTPLLAVLTLFSPGQSQSLSALISLFDSHKLGTVMSDILMSGIFIGGSCTLDKRGHKFGISMSGTMSSIFMLFSSSGIFTGGSVMVGMVMMGRPSMPGIKLGFMSGIFIGGMIISGSVMTGVFKMKL